MNHEYNNKSADSVDKIAEVRQNIGVREQRVALRDAIEGFLNILVHDVLGHARGMRHALDIDGVIAIDPVFFSGLKERGLLDEYYMTTSSLSFLQPDGLDELVGLESEFAALSSVAAIWLVAARRSSDCPGVQEAPGGGFHFPLSIEPSDPSERQGLWIQHEEVSQMRDRLGVDLMLKAWHSGVPVEHVIA